MSTETIIRIPQAVRWADYAFDECAYCNQHMGVFADTYEFNLHYMTCPFCGSVNMSGFIDGKFMWRLLPNIQKSMHPEKCDCGQFGHLGQELTEKQRTIFTAFSTMEVL